MTVMRSQWTLRRAILTLGWAATFCVTSGWVHAAETGCKAVFDAMLRAAAMPHHTFTTQDRDGKSVVSETIDDGKKIYVLIGGKWVVSPMTPQNLIDQEKENIQNGKSVCSVIRDESIDGVSATLYTTREEVGTNGQIWISKATGLPVRIKTDLPSDTRYVFSGISAPDVH
jgi:hypothetical protein